jgi:hypothetical protein
MYMFLSGFCSDVRVDGYLAISANAESNHVRKRIPYDDHRKFCAGRGKEKYNALRRSSEVNVAAGHADNVAGLAGTELLLRWCMNCRRATKIHSR